MSDAGGSPHPISGGSIASHTVYAFQFSPAVVLNVMLIRPTLNVLPSPGWKCFGCIALDMFLSDLSRRRCTYVVAAATPRRDF